jgi:hypothetical protein
MNEDYDWVKKVIESCSNEDHLHYIPGIIELFDKKWNWPGGWMELTELYHYKMREIGVLTEP